MDGALEVLDRIGYALVSMYGLLMTIAPIILVRLHNRGTGLQWDPVLIADQFALLQNPDVRALSAHLETCSYEEKSLDSGALELGYWKNRLGGTIWRGIAFAQKAKAFVAHCTISRVTAQVPSRYLPNKCCSVHV